MTVQDLIEKLERCPKMNEVYVQSFYSALNKVETVGVDRDNGFVLLVWKKD